VGPDPTENPTRVKWCVGPAGANRKSVYYIMLAAATCCDWLVGRGPPFFFPFSARPRPACPDPAGDGSSPASLPPPAAAAAASPPHDALAAGPVLSPPRFRFPRFLPIPGGGPRPFRLRPHRESRDMPSLPKYSNTTDILYYYTKIYTPSSICVCVYIHVSFLISYQILIFLFLKKEV
jgi:hypothetical protein